MIGDNAQLPSVSWKFVTCDFYAVKIDSNSHAY